jgi:hypothetical protein
MNTSGETSACTHKLEEVIEKCCSDILVHTLKCLKVFYWINGYLATKDDHNLWLMCTTSAKSRTVMTAMLTVMSGMDPHTISGNMGMGFIVGWELVGLMV